MSHRSSGLLAAALLLGGCITGLSAPGMLGDTTVLSALQAGPRPADVARDLDRALASDSRSDFVGRFAPQAQLQLEATDLFDNLSLLEDVTIAQVDGGLAIGWRVPGDRVGSVTTIGVDLGLLEGSTIVTALQQGEQPAVWQLGSIEVVSRGAVSVLAVDGVADERARQWVQHLREAVLTLREDRLGALDDDWSGGLVVILPATAAQFSELTGDAGVGAAAVTQCEQGNPRILVSPRVLGQDWDYLDGLLLHEAVHAAAQAPCRSTAPLWVDEGVAEWVAGRHNADAARTTATWSAEWVSRHGVPTALPSDASFHSSDPDEVSAAYALAAVAIGASVEHLGQRQTMAWIDAAADTTSGLDPELTQKLTRWYREALRELASG